MSAEKGGRPAEGDALVGSLWRRNPPGRETVRVERVWDYLDEGMCVRAHPTTGGRPIVAPVAYFREHFTRVTLPAATEGDPSLSAEKGGTGNGHTASDDLIDALNDTMALRSCDCPSCNFYALDYAEHQDEPCQTWELIRAYADAYCRETHVFPTAPEGDTS